MKRLIFICILLVSFACNKKKIFEGPNFYADDFEQYESIDDLILMGENQDKFWSFNQITKPENTVSLDSVNVHSGNKSIKFTAAKTDDSGASKASIAKQHMAFWEGETIRATAWYYIEGENKLDWLFLLDLEEKTAVGAGPGMRLTLVNNQLRVEYKFNEKDILQTVSEAKNFPRNQWVELVWEVKLSRKNKGEVRLWQNGELILETKNNTTLPKDILYFQQGTKGVYSNVEVGITANSRDEIVTLWVDDVKFEKVN